jgi:formylglycine-generating enzyme required for sulfatase activity
MTGNLNEWCNDLYSEAPNQGHIFDIHEKEFTFDLMSARDFALFNVVAKGGSWFNSPDYSKVYSRHCYNIMYPSSMVGIRLVRNA